MMNPPSFHRCARIDAALLSLHRNIGNTPLIRVHDDGFGGGISAKCEWVNAFGTVKDRAAFWMFVRALHAFSTLDDAQKSLHILEYSGGSLAFALARFCKALGVRCTLVVGAWAGVVALDELRSLDAEVVVTPTEMGFLQVIVEARRLALENPSWTFLSQHENPACLYAHERGTGPEILHQLGESKPDAWVASIGTGATLMGVANSLRTAHPHVEIHGVTPTEQPYGTLEPPNGLRKIAGSGGLGNGLRQIFVEDGPSTVVHWDVPYLNAMTRMITFESESGLRIGSSAAANLLVASQVHKRLGPGKVVVTVFPSAGTDAEWAYIRQAGFAAEPAKAQALF